MFLGSITQWSSVLNTDIPFTTVKSTNDRITNSNGILSFNRAGYYNIDSTLTVTGVAGNVSATVYADGVATTNVVSATLSEASDVETLPIVDAIKVTMAQYPSVGTISIRLNTAGLTVNGMLRAEYIS